MIIFSLQLSQITKWYEVWRVHHHGQLGEEMHAYVRFVMQEELNSIFLLLDVPGYSNLTSLDISNCINVEPSSVTEMSVVMAQLKIFTFRGCSQITEYHLAKVIDNCTQLIEVDGTGAGPVSGVLGIGMLCRIPNVKIFWVSPKASDLKQWSTIVSQWRRVNFGLEMSAQIEDPLAIEKFIASLPNILFP